MGVATDKASQDECSTYLDGVFGIIQTKLVLLCTCCSRQPLGLSSLRAAAGRLCKVWRFPMFSTLLYFSVTSVHLIRWFTLLFSHGWCMRCGGGGTKLRRRSVIRQPCQTSQQLDQGRFDKKRDTRCPTSHSRSRRAARDHAS